jgi:threonine/homoserine/homoserine lactone efflux protein
MQDIVASDIIPFFLAGFALVGTPGPATLTLAATSAAYGPRRGVEVMAGLLTSMAAIGAITAAGITTLLLSLPSARPIGAVLAGAYLLYLAWRIATAPTLDDKVDLKQAPSFVSGFLLNFVNPKAYAATAALFGGFVLVTADPMLDAIAKGGLMLVMIVIADVAWILAGAALAGAFRDPRANRVVNITFATLLLASVAAALLF